MSNTGPANCQVVNMQQTSSDYSEYIMDKAVVEMTLETPTQSSVHTQYQDPGCNTHHPSAYSSMPPLP